MLASFLFATLAFAPADDVASLTERLNSPSQAVRDAAAEQLRKVYKPAPHGHWEPVIAKIKPGEKKEAVVERIKEAMGEGKSEMGVGTGQSHMQCYRLDDRWLARCWFFNEGNVLREISLVEHMRHVWVAPPEDFSGVWITYFSNGQKSHEINYKNGKYFGEFIMYHAGGGKNVVQHYGAEGVDGEDTGYFPSGKISYQAFYKAGKPVGTWTHYNEDGTIRSTDERGKKKD
jgi:antitoxin component YwqK of YwqJK toxin-antitoxin module